MNIKDKLAANLQSRKIVVPSGPFGVMLTKILHCKIGYNQTSSLEYSILGGLGDIERQR